MGNKIRTLPRRALLVVKRPEKRIRVEALEEGGVLQHGGQGGGVRVWGSVGRGTDCTRAAHPSAAVHAPPTPHPVPRPRQVLVRRLKQTKVHRGVVVVHAAEKHARGAVGGHCFVESLVTAATRTLIPNKGSVSVVYRAVWTTVTS